MRKPVILVDVDGVLANFVGGVLQTLKLFGFKKTVDQITDLDLSKCLSKAEFTALESVIHKPGWCTTLEWYPLAKVFLEVLKDIGEVYAVTAPFQAHTWCGERLDWLSHYIPKERVIFTSAKHLIEGDFLIEDSPGNLINWQRPKRTGVLINRPWNQHGWDRARVQTFVDAVIFIQESYYGKA